MKTKACVLLIEGMLPHLIGHPLSLIRDRGGTDKTGGVRTVDGVQGVEKAKSRPAVGVKVLTVTPGLSAIENLLTEKLFWDIRQPN